MALLCQRWAYAPQLNGSKEVDGGRRERVVQVVQGRRGRARRAVGPIATIGPRERQRVKREEVAARVPGIRTAATEEGEGG